MNMKKKVLWNDNTGPITSHDPLLFPVGQILNCNILISCFGDVP